MLSYSCPSLPQVKIPPHTTTTTRHHFTSLYKGTQFNSMHHITNTTKLNNHHQKRRPTMSFKPSALLASVLMAALLISSSTANFYNDAEIQWGEGRAQILEGGNLLTLSLDKSSGSGFQSKNAYLYGRFDMQLKLVPGNSAGTVTTFFLSSLGQAHDEIDFEFLGNSTGEPYTVHTNVYAKGKGDKEQQFRLWFDPTAAFHTYSILWNPQRIIFSVDGVPLRVFRNDEAIGTPFPTAQPMRVYCSLWDAEDWATQGGRVKTDWTMAPFVASYRDFKIDGCVAGQACGGSQSAGGFGSQAWQTKELDAKERNRLRWVQKTHMIYNYCADLARFPQGLPQECKRSTV